MSITPAPDRVNARASPAPPVEDPGACPRCCDRRIWRLNRWATGHIPVCVWCDAADLSSDPDAVSEPIPVTHSIAKGHS
jgi:hypothetical protein